MTKHRRRHVAHVVGRYKLTSANRASAFEHNSNATEALGLAP